MLCMCVGFAVMADCPRCHGKGRVKTFASVSTFGISNKKQQCPICHQWVSLGDSHYDTCPQCGGSGNAAGSSSRRGSSSDDKLQEQSSELLSYLDPADVPVLENLLHTLFMGKLEQIKCEACNGSGYCHVCGGVQNLNIDATAADLCMACQGSGFCIACRGTGQLREEYVPWSGSEREQLVSNIKLYFDKAAERKRELEQMGSGSYESSGSQDDGNFGLPGVDELKHRSSSSKWPWILGGFGILLIGLFIGSRMKK